MTMSCENCMNRRQFLGAAAGAAGFGGLVTISACGDGEVTGPFAELPSGPVQIVVGSQPGLATVGVLVKVPEKAIAVKRTGSDTFDAFSMVCTHQGCQTSVAASGSRLDCPCHGSRFDANGAVINGPTSGEDIAPLPKFVTSYNAATDTLTIS